jgi:2-haloacid dehalogenase
LGVITNCDDDLFAAANQRLGEPFDWVVTAEQVRAYKPSMRNFEVALERIGRPPSVILHAAQSLYHDHLPAQRMGLRTAWIDRRQGRAGFGATPPAAATPSVSARDMTTFADLALAS